MSVFPSSIMERLPSVSEPPECGICSERYDVDAKDLIPRNLACGHSMCSRCIGRYMSTSGRSVEGGIEMTCPIKCTQQTIVTDGDVQTLPKNFAVMDIVHDHRFERMASRATLLTLSGEYNCDVCENVKAEVACPSCAVSLCLSCSDEIHSKRGYQIHRLVAMSDLLDGTVDILPVDGIVGQQPRTTLSDQPETLPGEPQKMCKVHTSELVEYLCETCDEEVCKQCHLVDGHRRHDCRLLTEVVHEKRQSLQHLLNAMKQKHTIWNKGFDRCQEVREYTRSRRNELEGAVKSHFHEIHSVLHSREEKILRGLEEEMASRDQLLSTQAGHLAKVCAMAKDLWKECEEVMGGSNSQVVSRAATLVAQVQQHIRSEQDTNPVVSDGIQAEFGDKGELLQLAERLGELKLPPGRVEGVEIKSRGVNEVHVTWQPLPSASITTYLVELSAGGRPYKVVYEDARCEYTADRFVIEEEDTLYYFRVAAVNDVGIGPYSMSVCFTQRKASFLWDRNLCHSKAHISSNGCTVSIGENATWVSVGATAVLSLGSHYWEVVLERYGSPSMSRKAVIGVVSSSFTQWHRSHGVIGIKTCPIGSRSWGLACGTAKKLSHGSTFLNSLGRKHNLFREGDAVGVLLDLSEHIMTFYRNGKPLGITFTDVYGPVIPAVSFCRNKTLTLRFPNPPSAAVFPPKKEEVVARQKLQSRSASTFMFKEVLSKTNSVGNSL